MNADICGGVLNGPLPCHLRAGSDRSRCVLAEGPMNITTTWVPASDPARIDAALDLISTAMVRSRTPDVDATAPASVYANVDRPNTQARQ